MKNTDHMHFCDRIEQVHELFRMMPPAVFEELAKKVLPIDRLAPSEQAYQCVRGLGLAHWDAALKDDAGARALLDGDLVGLLAARGLGVAVR